LIGDNYDSDGMTWVGEVYNQLYPSALVYSIHIDLASDEDRKRSFFSNIAEDLEAVCADLADIPELRDGFNAVGFSQGGQFLRGYVERCNIPPVKVLLTFGSQHNGISSFQACQPSDWLCRGSEGLLRTNTWTPWVQTHLVPAQYYRDPEDLESYREHSNFLADINNEKFSANERKELYRQNLSGLDKFVMYIFAEDTTVIPKESGWFQEVNVTSGEVTKLQDRAIYKEDWIGLKKLDEEKKLVFDTLPGRHMALSEEILNDAFGKHCALSSFANSPSSETSSETDRSGL
jgi:palmitoyl-protein thioesterase